MKPGIPSVVVLMPSYNHERFIAQAIDGVLSQVTDFDVCLTILDDASTDNTFQIASAFKGRNRVRINLERNEKNLGALENGAKLRAKAISSKFKYVSICDGDDFWIDSYKLQKQVDFLELNSDFVAHSHNAWILENGCLMGKYSDLNCDRVLTRVDLITSLAVPTASVIFRNVLKKPVPQYLEQLGMDIMIYYALSSHGKFQLSSEVMSVYRKHQGGIWTGQDEFKKINEAIGINRKLIQFLQLDESEVGVIKEVILKLRHQRIKSHANRYEFGFEYFEDIMSILNASLNGYKLSSKYFFYCLVPNSLVNAIQKIRGK